MGISGMNIIFRLRLCEVFFWTEVGQDAMASAALCFLGVIGMLFVRVPPSGSLWIGPGGFRWVWQVMRYNMDGVGLLYLLRGHFPHI